MGAGCWVRAGVWGHFGGGHTSGGRWSVSRVGVKEAGAGLSRGDMGWQRHWARETSGDGCP